MSLPIAYAYDCLLGPTTMIHHVSDVAAQHIVNGAMNANNGTVYAYRITSIK